MVRHVHWQRKCQALLVWVCVRRDHVSMKHLCNHQTPWIRRGHRIRYLFAWVADPAIEVDIPSSGLLSACIILMGECMHLVWGYRIGHRSFQLLWILPRLQCWDRPRQCAALAMCSKFFLWICDHFGLSCVPNNLGSSKKIYCWRDKGNSLVGLVHERCFLPIFF